MKRTKDNRGRLKTTWGKWALCCSVAGAAGISPAQAAQVTWQSPVDGFWDVAGNWNPAQLPLAPDDVTINQAGNITVTHRTGTDTINTLLSSNSFVLSGGSLAATSGATINGTFTQTNGSIAGGDFAVNGTANFSFGDHRGAGTTTLKGASTFTSNGLRLDAGRVLRNEGAMSLNNAGIDLNGNILFTSLPGAGRLDNAVGASITANDNAVISANNFGGTDTGADAVFNNAGSFVKAGGAETTSTIGVTFNNTGSVDVQSGNLALSRGGDHTGSFNVASGATLGFDAGTHNLNAGSTITAPGTVRVGGIVNIAPSFNVAGNTLLLGGTLNLLGGGSTGSLTQSGGSLTGINLTVNGATIISFGDQRGAGTTILKGASTVTSSGLRLDAGRVLRNEGAMSLNNAGIDLNGNINFTSLAGSGRLDNAVGATISANDNAGISANSFGGTDTGADAVFNNAGSFVKAGGAQTFSSIAVTFNNTGSVDVQTGDLSLSRGGDHTGSFNVATGATLGFDGGTHNLNAGSTLTAPGTVRVAGGIVNVTPAYNVAGITLLQGGTLNLPGGGSTGSLTQSSGSVTGGNLTVNGAATFTFGDQRGAGTTILKGTSTFTSNGLRLDAGRVLRNEGAMSLNNAGIDLNGNINFTSLAGSGRLDNVAGASITANDNAGISANSFGGTDTGADAVFNNAGSFVKAGGAQTTSSIGVTFNNTGSVDVQAGNLNLINDSSLGGSLKVANGTTLALSSGTHNFGPTTNQIDGTLALGSGILNLSANQTLNGVGTFQQTSGTVQGGDLTLATAANFSFGDHRGAGTTILKGASTLTSSGLRLDAGRVLRNEGAMSLNNAGIDLNGNINFTSLAGSGRLDNVLGATITANDNAGISANNFGGTDTGADAVFNNAGSFVKAGGAQSTSTIGVTFNNTGSVDVQAGNLSLSKDSSLGGSLKVANGNSLALSGGTHNFSPTTNLIDGTLALNSGILNLSGTQILNGAGTFQQGNGSVQGGDLVLATAANFSFGDHRGAGTTTLKGASTLTSSGLRLDAGRVLRNEGAMSLNNTGINLNSNINSTSLAGSGRLDNVAGASITANDNAGISANNFGGTDTGADAVFNNAGSFVKAGGTQTTSTIGVTFNNTGSVDVQNGNLSLSKDSSLGGSLKVANGATLALSGGTHNFGPTTNLIDGTLALNSGILNLNGTQTLTGAGTFQQGSGSVQGGDLVLATDANFSFGDHRGGGTTILKGASTFTSNGLRLDAGRVLRNEGAMSLNNTGIDLNSNINSTSLAGSGRLDNIAGASITANGSTSISAIRFGGTDTDADAVFNNAGSFVTTGTANTSSTIGVTFNNSGSVDVQAGNLSLSKDSSLGGSLKVGNGATLALSGGTHSFGLTTNQIDGTLALNSGILNLNGTQTLTGAGTFQQGSGSVQGGDLVLATAANFSFGDHRGPGTTILKDASTFTNNGLFLDAGRVLRNEGAMSLNGTGINLNFNINSTSLAGSGRLDNVAGASITANGFNNIRAANFGGTDTGADAVFNNAGSFVTTGPANTNSSTAIDVTFNNTGSVDVQAGNLSLQRAFTNAGTIRTASGTGFSVAGGFSNGQQGVLEGEGGFGSNGFTLVNQGLIRPAGAGSTGTLSVVGSFQQTSTGDLQAELASLSDFDILSISGSATFGGALILSGLDGFAPKLGDEFTVALFTGSRNGSFDSIRSLFRGITFDAIYDASAVRVVVTSVEAVPVPPAFWLLASALAGMGLIGRRRNDSKA